MLEFQRDFQPPIVATGCTLAPQSCPHLPSACAHVIMARPFFQVQATWLPLACMPPGWTRKALEAAGSAFKGCPHAQILTASIWSISIHIIHIYQCLSRFCSRSFCGTKRWHELTWYDFASKKLDCGNAWGLCGQACGLCASQRRANWRWSCPCRCSRGAYHHHQGWVDKDA